MKRILICFIVSIMLFMEGILPVQASQGQKEPLEISGLVYDHSMELDYAEQFSVDYYKDGYALITIADKDRFLIVPEGKRRRNPWMKPLQLFNSRCRIFTLWQPLP